MRLSYVLNLNSDTFIFVADMPYCVIARKTEMRTINNTGITKYQQEVSNMSRTIKNVKKNDKKILKNIYIIQLVFLPVNLLILLD